mmetsp:Transcript_15948/g.47957  ORF Transcript_15948/g.47957 Transcript_15948/m.47957 type:complete len:231 (+) Transcript_15948:1525-2217(+)
MIIAKHAPHSVAIEKNLKCMLCMYIHAASGLRSCSTLRQYSAVVTLLPLNLLMRSRISRLTPIASSVDVGMRCNVGKRAITGTTPLVHMRLGVSGLPSASTVGVVGGDPSAGAVRVGGAPSSPSLASIFSALARWSPSSIATSASTPPPAPSAVGTTAESVGDGPLLAGTASRSSEFGAVFAFFIARRATAPVVLLCISDDGDDDPITDKELARLGSVALRKEVLRILGD